MKRKAIKRRKRITPPVTEFHAAHAAVHHQTVSTPDWIPEPPRRKADRRQADKTLSWMNDRRKGERRK